MVKNLPAYAAASGLDPWVGSLATYSGFLAWEVPWTEEPSGLKSMGSQVSEP